MKRLERASEEDTLTAWDDLRNAIQRVECAQPFQMTEAIERLNRERLKFDNLMKEIKK